MKTTIEKLQLNGLDIDGEISSKLAEYSQERKRHGPMKEMLKTI